MLLGTEISPLRSSQAQNFGRNDKNSILYRCHFERNPQLKGAGREISENMSNIIQWCIKYIIPIYLCSYAILAINFQPSSSFIKVI